MQVSPGTPETKDLRYEASNVINNKHQQYQLQNELTASLLLLSDTSPPRRYQMAPLERVKQII